VTHEVLGTRGLARTLKALTGRFPRLRPLLPAAVLAATWPSCHTGEGPLVAFLGDSLTSGWKLREDEAWPALLGRTLAGQGRPIRVLNAGVSGETAAEGLARLRDVLARKPDVLVVALGINDGMNGRSLDKAETALRRILEDGHTSGACLLLVGTRIPKERYGAEYALRFEEMYIRLAAEEKVAFVPDLLAGVAGQEELLFGDRLHPNAAGHLRLAETVRPHLELVLAEVETGHRARRARD
jgi:acyl-CoA thioesterase-1